MNGIGMNRTGSGKQGSPLVLVYGMEGVQRTDLEKILKRCRLTFRFVEAGQENAPVGLLAGRTGWKNGGGMMPESDLTEPMLVLCDLGDRVMDVLLRELRQGGFRGVLKAVLTPFNIGWTGRQLQTELKREREAMRRR